MRKSILIVLCALISQSTFAQDDELSWNIKAGMNVSNFTSGDNTKAKIGFRAGVGMEYSYDETWSVLSSLLFTTKGAKINTKPEDRTINAMYLQLPVMAGVRLYLSDYSSVLVTAGPYVEYGVGGKITTKNSDENQEKQNTFGNGRAKRFDVGFGTGVAYEWEHIFISANAEFGFLKVIDLGSGSPKNISLAINLGYKF